MIRLTLDGIAAEVPEGTTVFEAARMQGIAIPALCHQQNEAPVGVCRVCVVESGGRVLTASCVRPVEEGMVVSTQSDRVVRARRLLLEFLLADHPPCARERQSGDCELEAMARAHRVQYSRFATRPSPRGRDDSSLSIAVDHQACILCDRCIRGCNEIRHNNVLGRRGKGYDAGIAFDLDVLMANSSCVSCGECIVSCPTGALTNRQVVAAVLPHGEPVDVDELKHLHFFQNVSGTFLDLNKNAVVRRRFKKGEIVCREGEYGSTAFYILEGKVNVFLATPLAHVKTAGGSTGLIGKLGSHLSGRKQDRREGETDRRSIPIDAPVDLPYDNPIAELGPGDLFGEMTCISHYPRSATVQASTDCVMYEMLGNVLDILLRNPALKAKIDDNYRRRALEDHLKSVPIFASLSSEFIDSLRSRVELVHYNKGEVICRQGDIADAFYLIRIGFVKVSEEHGAKQDTELGEEQNEDQNAETNAEPNAEPNKDGELVLAYLGRGGYFGEIGLLGAAENGEEAARRIATCTALDHVELVRIHASDFHRMIEAFPDVRRGLEKVARQHIEQNRQRVSKSASVPLAQFLAQGLMDAQSLLILDLEKCTRCDDCVRACADAHDGVTRLIREGLRFDKYLVATSCRQCRDPLCMIGCPVGAIRRRNSLEVIIEDWCIGCGLCAKNCPYGNINMHPFETATEGRVEITTGGRVEIATGGRAEITTGGRANAVHQKATSCDLCTDQAEPSCVYACPHDAAHRVEPNQFFGSLVRPGA